MRTLSLVLILLAQIPAAAQAASCNGADPAITSVKVANVASDGGANHYTLAGTVTNLGSAKQSTNVLQFVDIYQGKTRLEDRGIPPLAPGQSYNWTYVWTRASDAGNGTTTFHFSIRMTQPAAPGAEDCNTANDTYTLTF